MDWRPESDTENELVLIEPQQNEIAGICEAATNNAGKTFVPRPAYQLEHLKNKRREKQKTLEKLSPDSQGKIKVFEFLRKITPVQHEEDYETALQNFEKGVYVERETLAMMRLAGVAHAGDRQSAAKQPSMGSWPIPKRMEINHNGSQKLPILYGSEFFKFKAPDKTKLPGKSSKVEAKERGEEVTTTTMNSSDDTCEKVVGKKSLNAVEIKALDANDVLMEKTWEKSAEEKKIDELLLRFESGPLTVEPTLKADLDAAKEYMRTNIKLHNDKCNANSTKFHKKQNDALGYSDFSLSEYEHDVMEPKSCDSTKRAAPTTFMIDNEVVTFRTDQTGEPSLWRPDISADADAAQRNKFESRFRKKHVFKKASNEFEHKPTKPNAWNTQTTENSTAANNNENDFELLKQNLHVVNQSLAAYLAKIEQRSQEKDVQTNLQLLAKELDSIKSMVSVHLPQNNEHKIVAVQSKLLPSTNEHVKVAHEKATIAVDILPYKTPLAPAKSKGYAALNEDDTSEEEADRPLLDNEAYWETTSSENASADISDFEETSEVFYSAENDLEF